MADVIIREQEPGDVFRIVHARFSPETVYRRFHSSKSRLTRRDTRHLSAADGTHHISLVAEDRATGAIAGVARLIRMRPGSTTAGMSIMIADGYQRKGIGRRLLCCLSVRARQAGLHTIMAETQSDNYAFKKLFADTFPSATSSMDGASSVFAVEIDHT